MNNWLVNYEGIFQDIGLLVLFLVIGFIIGRLYRAKFVKGERADAIERSKSVILGEVYEKVSPFLPDFPFKPRDMVFLGKGVDYVVLDGISEGALQKIIFLELKTGNATLNKNEKMIRDAVRSGRVEYQELRWNSKDKGFAK